MPDTLGHMEIAMIDEGYFQHAMATWILPAIRTCRTEGFMEPATRDWRGRPLRRIEPLGRLHWVTYDVARFQELEVPGASRHDHGTVVISHGFSEFAAKYAELVWYFLLAGFSVCILEHRGHGYSQRDCADPQLVYVDDWRRYVADFATFTQEIGRTQAGDGPLYLFAHSMGGGIAAAMLERYPGIVDRAVLSSPMIKANTGAPNWLAATVCGLSCDLGHPKAMAPGQRPFSPVVDWSRERGASAARLEWFQKLRNADTHYRTCAATDEWVRQAVRLSHAILRKDDCAYMATPTLLFQAGRDTWVRNGAQDRFAQRVNQAGGHLRTVRIADSLHEVFSMPNRTMAPYLRQVFQFLQSDESVSVLP